MQGAGTDETKINKVLAGRTFKQRTAILEAYNAMYKRELLKVRCVCIYICQRESTVNRPRVCFCIGPVLGDQRGLPQPGDGADDGDRPVCRQRNQGATKEHISFDPKLTGDPLFLVHSARSRASGRTWGGARATGLGLVAHQLLTTNIFFCLGMTRR